ncbi:MAG TPA: hypothetical protein VIJ20_14005 [Solirubrobacteraceae bacterium]
MGEQQRQLSLCLRLGGWGVEDEPLVGGILGILADSYTGHQVRAAVPAIRALSDGYQLAFAVGAVFCIVGAASALALLRPRRPMVRETADTADPVEVLAA